MADNDRVVYPDEVDDAKAKAAEAAGSAGAGNSNSVEEAQEASQETSTDTTSIPKIGLRNVIQVPYNCPDGYVMDENGVCREVF